MKCHNIMCQDYNSNYVDNCCKVNFHIKDCPDLIFKRDCSNCKHLVRYEGCPYIMQCKNLSKWEELK